MDGLTEGRIVHYICRQSDAHRAAIVVNVRDKEQGLCDLFVFGMPDDGGFFLATAVGHGNLGVEDTWHWIEKA